MRSDRTKQKRERWTETRRGGGHVKRAAARAERCVRAGDACGCRLPPGWKGQEAAPAASAASVGRGPLACRTVSEVLLFLNEKKEPQTKSRTCARVRAHTRARTRSRHCCEGDAWERLRDPVAKLRQGQGLSRVDDFWPSLHRLRVRFLSFLTASDHRVPCCSGSLDPVCSRPRCHSPPKSVSQYVPPGPRAGPSPASLPPLLPPSFVLLVQNPDPLGPAHGPLKGRGGWGCRGPASPSLGPGSSLPTHRWGCGPSWHCASATLST